MKTMSDQNELIALLQKCDVSYERFDHKAVFTCAESEEIDAKIPGAHTKQLLMRDKKKRHYVMAIVMHDKTVDTIELGKQLDTGRFSFASSDDLMKFLHVEPGSVTPFGLMFDAEHTIRLIIDEDAWAVGQFRFHPLVNTATLVIDREGFEKFLQETGHAFEVMKIPQKEGTLSS